MPTAVERLLELQKLDQELRSVREKQSALPELLGIAELQAGVQEQKGKESHLQEALSAAGRRLRSAELDIRKLSDEIKSLNQRLYSGQVTNAKELGRIQEKADACRESLRKSEEQALEGMLEIEAFESEAEACRAGLAARSARLSARQAEFDETRSALEIRLRELLDRREEAAKALGPSTLAQYERLSRTKQGRPVAEVQGDLCLACRVTLPTYLLGSTKKNDRLVLCESCGRILCWLDQPPRT